MPVEDIYHNQREEGVDVDEAMEIIGEYGSRQVSNVLRMAPEMRNKLHHFREGYLDSEYDKRRSLKSQIVAEALI
jgi:hypothetical protein